MHVQFDAEELKPLIQQIVQEVTSGQQVLHDGRLCFHEDEAAGLLGLEKHVLRDTRRRGEIDYCRIVGGRVVYLMKHLQDYLGERNVPATA